MSESTYDAAMNALEESGFAPDTDDPTASQQVPAGTPEATDQPGVELPASKDVDLSGLPEEAQIFLRARQREMERGMHEKFQEAAQQRQEAEQAIAFIEALNSDPNFAYQVLSRIQDQLAQAGYEFDQGGAAQDEYYGTDDYEADAGPDPYEQELNELKMWRDQMEAQWREAALTAQLDRQIAEIRSQHPDWNDDDIQSVLDYGFATGGNLLQAADMFQAQQDRILARYLEGKKGVTAPSVLPTGQATAPPEDLRNATERELRDAALQRVLNEIQ